MSNSRQGPYSQFSRVAGRFNSLAPFVIMSGSQESNPGTGDITTSCYHTKLYTTRDASTVNLGSAQQDGQLKKLTFVHKGKDEAVITVNCPLLTDVYSEIQFSNVGDTCLLLWTGGTWCVLETLNIVNPSLQTPVVL
jgi:hypothetical protein